MLRALFRDQLLYFLACVLSASPKPSKHADILVQSVFYISLAQVAIDAVDRNISLGFAQPVASVISHNMLLKDIFEVIGSPALLTIFGARLLLYRKEESIERQL